MSETKVTARWTDASGACREAEVLNPGAWFGKCWLVTVGGSYWPLEFVVEADTECDAWDELAEDERCGHLVRIDEADYGDYGSECGPGDQIGGRKITEADCDERGRCWVDLNGKVVPGPLAEPHWSGGGTPYDTDELYIDELPEGLTYHGVYDGRELPEEGVDPEWLEPLRCDNCWRDFYRTASWPDKTFCSERCRRDWELSGEEGRLDAPLTLVCLACERETVPLTEQQVAAGEGALTVPPHFDHYAGGDFALPAFADDQVFDNGLGKTWTVCPGSGLAGPVERRCS